MGIFNFFGKKETVIRDFYSDAGNFSMEEISKWMKEVQDNPDLIPPLLNDEYTSSLIERLGNESDITIVQDSIDNGIRNIALSIERNGQDAVSIQYALYNPHVVYFTTGWYPIAMDSLTFNKFASQLITLYPFLQLGADGNFQSQELDRVGRIPLDVFAIRTLIPLLGGSQDYDNLVNIARCLPVYGYDLKDGFYTNRLHPYPNRQGINTQLAKILKIIDGSKASNEVPTMDALWGNTNVLSIIPLKISNKLVNSITPQWINKDMFGGDYEGIYGITCNKNLKNLWTIFTTIRYEAKTDEEVNSVISFLSEFNFPFSTFNDKFPGLHQAIILDRDENFVYVSHSFVGCIPNEVHAKVIAWQIAKFFTININSNIN